MDPLSSQALTGAGAPLVPERREGERSEPDQSGGASGAAAAPPEGLMGRVPDPEVTGRAARRRFTAEYKRRILRAADACSRGEQGALLRREGLYSSLLNEWRRQRERGEIAALAPKKRGRKGKTPHPLEIENQQLRKEIDRLRRRLQRTETILEIQKKASELLGIPLNSPKDEEAE